MSRLEGLKPAKVWDYFEQICEIPHGSGNVEQISNFLKQFGEERGLETIQDEVFNIIIKKPGSKGREKEEPVILQGHMDMVAVKTASCTKNLVTDGLDVTHDGVYVYAEGTSLGGDDGIALAYGMALLDEDSLSLPPLEVVFTVDEETGMEGARNLDFSVLSGRRMINLDSEEEGEILTSCAGGAMVCANLPVKREKMSGYLYEVSISGLRGGHSGCDIHLERGNAICLLAQSLSQVMKEVSYSLFELTGGEADNVIPKEAVACICVFTKEDKTEEELYQEITQLLSAKERELRQVLGERDPGLSLAVKRMQEGALLPQLVDAVCISDTVKLIRYLMAAPNGVIAYVQPAKDMVETSLNLGTLQLQKESLLAGFCVRSSIDQAKMQMIETVTALTAICDGTVEVAGIYPGWRFQKESPFRDHLARIYYSMYGKKARITSMHAGVECGFFAGKCENLECVSVGPDILDIHTTNEKLSIASVERMWNYLLRVLSEAVE